MIMIVVVMVRTFLWVCLWYTLLFLNFLLSCTREADDMKEQIKKKCQALSAADPGSDLFSVQALQRQHENFERDLIPLREKVRHELLSFSNIFLFLFLPMMFSSVLLFPSLYSYISLYITSCLF